MLTYFSILLFEVRANPFGVVSEDYQIEKEVSRVNCGGDLLLQSSTAVVIYSKGHPQQQASTATSIHCIENPLQVCDKDPLKRASTEQRSTEKSIHLQRASTARVIHSAATLSTAMTIYCDHIRIIHCDGSIGNGHPLPVGSTVRR